MPRRANDVPRLFFDSSTLTIVVIALAKFGPLTSPELAEVCNLDRTRISRSLAKLERLGITIRYAWAGRRPKTGEKWLRSLKGAIPSLYDLDRGHPLFLRIGDLGRCLARNFAPPGTPRQGRRHYRGPKPAAKPLTKEDLRLFGDTPAARILYFLSWARNVPIRQMGSALNISKGINHTVKVLKRHGIVAGNATHDSHRLNLNKEFCAYWSMLEIGRAIDRITGLEFKGLARARRVKLAIKKMRAIHRRAALRRQAVLKNRKYRAAKSLK